MSRIRLPKADYMNWKLES